MYVFKKLERIYINFLVNRFEKRMSTVYRLSNESKYCKKTKNINTTFSEEVMKYCEEKGIENANQFSNVTFLNRNIYNKLSNNSNYIPDENTAYTICFGLKLTFAESTDLLHKANYSMTPINKNDLYRELLVEMLITGKQFIPHCNNTLRYYGYRELGSSRMIS